VETYPLPHGSTAVIDCRVNHVLAFQHPQKGRQGASLLVIVENRRLRAGHTTQRTVLYLGEINDTQQAAWRKSLDALNEATQLTERICLFPADREIPPDVLNGLQVKLSELTSTYFEGAMEQAPKAKHGYSRDKRSDCRQVVIAVVLSPEGFPLAYEVMPGNTSDKTTLRLFLEKIQTQYGKAHRIWIMDRGIPTEETLQEMRQSDPPVSYLVGTPRARWDQFKDQPEAVPWQKLRDTVAVKLLAQGDEVYVLAKSQGRRAKERAIRRRKLARLLRTLRALRRTRQRLWKRDTLLHKLGAAHKEAGKAWGFVKITVPKARQPVNRDTFQFQLLKDKLQDAENRDGHYLLRAFRAGDQAGSLWELYMQLTEIEAAFKTLKSDLQLRPIRHHGWSWRNRAGSCRPNRHRGSARHRFPRPQKSKRRSQKCSGDLWDRWPANQRLTFPHLPQP